MYFDARSMMTYDLNGGRGRNAAEKADCGYIIRSVLERSICGMWLNLLRVYDDLFFRDMNNSSRTAIMIISRSMWTIPGAVDAITLTTMEADVLQYHNCNGCHDYVLVWKPNACVLSHPRPPWTKTSQPHKFSPQSTRDYQVSIHTFQPLPCRGRDRDRTIVYFAAPTSLIVPTVACMVLHTSRTNYNHVAFTPR